jgi:iron complex transport system substrate-binding protein
MNATKAIAAPHARRIHALTLALTLLATLLATLAAAGVARADAGGRRIVSVSGALTEIVYALGAEDALVGVDTTSTWPAAARDLPQVGYQRTLSAEGILSLRPTQVLLTPDAGPPEVLALLEQARVPLHRVSAEPSPRALLDNVRAIAAALGRTAEGERLALRLEHELTALTARLRALEDAPRVLFLLNTGQGQLLASGSDTKADAMLALAGARNAVSGYRGYKPLSAEAAAAAAPEALLITSEGLRLAGGLVGLRAGPGLALTPALREGRVVEMDGLLLLGFGPRLPQALRELALALHPGLTLPARVAGAGADAGADTGSVARSSSAR